MKQNYSKAPVIEGVEITPLTTHYSDDGSFTEVGRFSSVPNLQINHSVIQPGAIKAFHAHEGQIDWWACWEPLLVILHKPNDINSRSEVAIKYGQTMRFVLCNQRLKIPAGTLHGCRNLNNHPVSLLYAVDQFFNPENPDELRFSWDILGAYQWEMSRG